MTAIVEKWGLLRRIVVGLKKEPAARFGRMAFFADFDRFGYVFSVPHDYFSKLKGSQLPDSAS